MKKLYLDTNIFIDILTERDESITSFKEILPYLKHSQIYLSTLSIHITYYTLKIKQNSGLDKKVQNYIRTINLVDLSEEITLLAISNFTTDFEDTLQYCSAFSRNCDYILTRDPKDFNKIRKTIPSDIEIITTLEKFS